MHRCHKKYVSSLSYSIDMKHPEKEFIVFVLRAVCQDSRYEKIADQIHSKPD